MTYPLESLLRQPVEWVSSVTCLIAALWLWVFPNYFWFSVTVSDVIATALTIFGVCRFFQGYRVVRYRRCVKGQDTYALSSDELPISATHLFLGKGFLWGTQHTQRLHELKQAKNERHLQPIKRKGLVNALGGNPAIHGVGFSEKSVFLNLADRVGHTMLLGTTRVGKTRLLELMISSDIRRNDSAVIVIDPKGDVDLLKRLCYEAKQVGREEEVIIFHLGYPKSSARYNPIGQFARITEVANRVANQLPSEGESAAFKEFAWRFVNIIVMALVALGRKPNYRELNQYILNSEPLLLEYAKHWLPSVDVNWRAIVERRANLLDPKKLPSHLKSRQVFMIALVTYIDELNVNNPIYDGLRAMFQYDQTYFQKITASLSPLFSKLTSGAISDLISPDYTDLDDERPIFDWLSVIRGKKIVYVGLDALSDSTVSSAVGNSMFADLCSTIGQIYKFGIQEGITDKDSPKTFQKVNLYSDEFNELAGDEFIPLANKGGGAGLQLTVATQTGSDVLARLKSQAKANQVFGNFNTMICLRVVEEATARLLIDKLPKQVPVKELIQASSTNDASNLKEDVHFSTHQEDRLSVTNVPMLSAEDLMQLPKGHAFCLLGGGKLYKVRFPLPKNDMKDMPDSVEAIVSNLDI